MKISVLFLFFFLLATLTAQQTKLDSLENLLPQKQGEEKVNLLNELC